MNFKKNIQSIIFCLLCFVSVMLICSPLLIRIPCVYTFVHWILLAFKTSDYKIVYIETIGSLMGTFLAITGALWTQKKIDENNEQEKIKKIAAIIYYDLKLNIDNFKQIMMVIYPHVKSNVLPDNDEILTRFRKAYNKQRIYFVPNWRELVIELQSSLSGEQTRELLIIYGKLSMISMSFNAAVNERSKKEDKNAYNLLHSFFSVSFPIKEPIVYEYDLKEEIDNLLMRLKEISQIKDTE